MGPQCLSGRNRRSYMNFMWVTFDGREILSRVHYTSSLHKLGYAPCLSGSSSRLRESLGPLPSYHNLTTIYPQSLREHMDIPRVPRRGHHFSTILGFPIKRHSSQGGGHLFLLPFHGRALFFSIWVQLDGLEGFVLAPRGLSYNTSNKTSLLSHAL